MLRAIYEDIQCGQEVRKNLIELKKLLKEESNRIAFIYYLAGDYNLFYELLENEDAKVRKNMALIMGELGDQSFMKALYKAYQIEDKLFVKADYLTALSKLDYRELLEDLKERLTELTNSSFEETSMKHINEEIKLLTRMILDIEGTNTHKFVGYNELSDLILLTNRDHQEVTAQQITDGIKKVFNAGVMVRTNNLQEVLKIRTYSELLFRLKGVAEVEMEPVKAAEAIYKGGLLEFLTKRHKGEVPYYFRLEIKTKMPLDKKSAFAKKLAFALESISDRALINSTSNYELEIRLVESKEGKFNVLLKLYTIKDERFNYRKHAVAASIQPVTAALVARLAKDYLKEDGQVLDPFCGVGTMLIERNKLVPANPMYGIDTFGEAIDKAILNAKKAECQINFINRDFFDFTHNYLFDEIFTNMPTRGGRKTEEEMVMLYKQFFNKALKVLKDEAVIVMYTRDRHLVLEEVLCRNEYKIRQEYVISKKEDAYLYIIEVKQ